ncbi:MAG: hypothetical protein JWP78_760 [Mucilaginibacter sp.]|nr:hypothetical protein [Mucilaginibacter sp.]
MLIDCGVFSTACCIFSRFFPEIDILHNKSPQLLTSLNSTSHLLTISIKHIFAYLKLTK